MSAIVLVGAPGAGCSTVASAICQATGAQAQDLGQVVAHALGVRPELALVAVPEERYRQVEAVTATRLLEDMGRQGAGVLALGSGCLGSPQVLAALEGLGPQAAVVGLGASTRRLASRNGLDAPRSIAMGTVHHQFTQMLRQREATCRELASAWVDTTGTTAKEAACLVLEAVAGKAPEPSDTLAWQG